MSSIGSSSSLPTGRRRTSVSVGPNSMRARSSKSHSGNYPTVRSNDPHIPLAEPRLFSSSPVHSSHYLTDLPLNTIRKKTSSKSLESRGSRNGRPINRPTYPAEPPTVPATPQTLLSKRIVDPKAYMKPRDLSFSTHINQKFMRNGPFPYSQNKANLSAPNIATPPIFSSRRNRSDTTLNKSDFPKTDNLLQLGASENIPSSALPHTVSSSKDKLDNFASGTPSSTDEESQITDHSQSSFSSSSEGQMPQNRLQLDGKGKPSQSTSYSQENVENCSVSDAPQESINSLPGKPNEASRTLPLDSSGPIENKSTSSVSSEFSKSLVRKSVSSAAPSPNKSIRKNIEDISFSYVSNVDQSLDYNDREDSDIESIHQWKRIGGRVYGNFSQLSKKLRRRTLKADSVVKVSRVSYQHIIETRKQVQQKSKDAVLTVYDVVKRFIAKRKLSKLASHFAQIRESRIRNGKENEQLAIEDIVSTQCLESFNKLDNQASSGCRESLEFSSLAFTHNGDKEYSGLPVSSPVPNQHIQYSSLESIKEENDRHAFVSLDKPLFSNSNNREDELFAKLPDLDHMIVPEKKHYSANYYSSSDSESYHDAIEDIHMKTERIAKSKVERTKDNFANVMVQRAADPIIDNGLHSGSDNESDISATFKEGLSLHLRAFERLNKEEQQKSSRCYENTKKRVVKTTLSPPPDYDELRKRFSRLRELDLQRRKHENLLRNQKENIRKPPTALESKVPLLTPVKERNDPELDLEWMSKQLKILDRI
ncbi:hypothetical protein CANCADRAFT_2658 [Tortispora caseinolytica NRRL Y-17796]|uniref:Uncharacterized protein n=1 Tax=Tortispora caseinolytica NRRL Y-17796 TaxID=767744 RepID=A0A1E4TGR3_9ASCO|nr:hypothetical protein CANCADRAFT_2658 [Tortispora caseinolytica NRRL Y-17796]